MSDKDLFKPRFHLSDVTVHNKERLFKRFFAIDRYDVSYKKFSGGETKVLGAADEFHLREMPLNPVRAAVCGVVVHHEDVGILYGRKAALQPGHAVVGDDYDKDAFHANSFR